MHGCEVSLQVETVRIIPSQQSICMQIAIVHDSHVSALFDSFSSRPLCMLTYMDLGESRGTKRKEKGKR